MNSVNVLILSAGRQVFLVQAFREAQKLLKNTGLVITADADSLSPSLRASDIGLVAPKTDSNTFTKWIIDLSLCYKPLLLLTLYERDLYVLEPIRLILQNNGCKLIGLPTPSLEVCLDKQKLAEFCTEIGLQAPSHWAVENYTTIKANSFPLLAKEKCGRGSRGQFIVNSIKELDILIRSSKADFIIQELVPGVEYGLDIINDLEGNFVNVLARQKLLMRDGETSISKIVDPKPFLKMAKLLSLHLSHQGCLDVDIIQSCGNIYVLDINPRFGGGYPFSHFAGANLPAALLSWFFDSGKSNHFFSPKIGQISAKTSNIHLISE